MRVALLFVVAALPLRAEDIVVTNSGDAVNGDVSSPAALHMTPGPDGISLREAILAANNAPGPDAIRFDSSLARQSISLGSSLPEISTDGISILGPVDSADEPLITIVNPPGSQGSILSVRASHFTLCRLSFVDLREGGAVGIRTGSPPQPPNDITDLRIQGNYFKGLAGGDYINAVTVGVENRATNASITDVTIASNKFVDIRNADSVGMGAGASVNGRLADVFVAGNLFLSSSFGVEIASSAVGGRVEHVYIGRNTFLDNFQPITLSGSIGLQGFPPAHDNVTRDVIITNNYIARSQNPAFSIVGGVDASSSVLEDVEISNNVIAENQSCAICLNGGGSFVSSATRNHVRALRIVNNTITGVGFAAELPRVPLKD